MPVKRKPPAKSRNAAMVSDVRPTSTHHHVSVRKIENGFIVSQSHDGPKGYQSKEFFTKTPPKVKIDTGVSATPRSRK